MQGMPLLLTWDDLLIKNFKAADAREWLTNWSGWIEGEVKPVFLSKFGDWFLRLADGSTAKLSVLEGMYDLVASTPEEFTEIAKAPAWQQAYLHAGVLQQVYDRGLIPKEGECIGFDPHPVIAGRLDATQAVVMEIGAWQAVCARTFSERRKKK
jgi:hypothetical protein